MAQQAFTIHEEPETEIEPQGASRAPIESRKRDQRQVDDETDSAESEGSDDEVDETVAEDMRRLEENFAGISKKYRLINRIGEGKWADSHPERRH